MEGEGGDFEAQTGDDEHHAQPVGRLHFSRRSELGQFIQVEGAAYPVDKGDTHDHDRRGQSRHNEIFDARFQRGIFVIEVADQHVEGDGNHFHGQEKEC